jgi:hypothetical protein
MGATPLFRDQNDAISQLLSQLQERDDIHLYVRAHPNLSGLENAQMRGLYALRANNLTVITPESPIDTYALMDACARTLTFGSTTGVEATFWGRPSILYGRAYYEGLDVVYEPSSISELVTLLTVPHLDPKPRLGALKFAYWYIATATEVKTYRAIYHDVDEEHVFDMVGKRYMQALKWLWRIHFPITYLPFRKTMLRWLAAHSRRRFRAGLS